MSNRSSVPSVPRWAHSQRWNRMSATSHRTPSLHACARSKQMQPLLQAFLARKGRGPHLDRLMAPQRQGPMAQGLLKKTGTQDADPRLSSYGFLANNAMQACPLGLRMTLTTAAMPTANMPVRIHCKTGTTSARLVLSTRPNCQEFVATYRDDGLLYAVDSPFLYHQCHYFGPTIQKHQKIEKSANVCTTIRFWLQSYGKFSLIMTPKAITFFQPLISEHRTGPQRI